jgi:hypothetical protein
LNRSSRRSRTSAAVIDAIREAANSIANGIPSRRRQTSATVVVSPANEPETALSARSTNSSTAAPTSSEGTRHNRSSATPIPSRLVAKTFTVDEAARMTSTRSATLSTTCSQLSNTNSRERPSNADATDSLTFLPNC